VSKGSVYNLLQRFKQSGLNYETSFQQTDGELWVKLFPKSTSPPKSSQFHLNLEEIHAELMKPNVTLQLLWEDYFEENPGGLKRSAFFNHYRKYKKKLNPSMKQEHVGGEKLYIDYSGDKASYVDRVTGKVVDVEIFVCTWGASSYCYVEASHSQKLQEWIQSNINALKYFQCGPVYMVPDNLKSAVLTADFYDPEINQSYNAMAQHYDAAVLPARSRKPKDKASVESNVRAIQCFILGRLRNLKFYSLNELNQEIWRLLELFNNRPMQEYKISRKERFEKLDKPFAQLLPNKDYLIKEIQVDLRVRDYYHVLFNEHYYSVPFELKNCKVDVHLEGKVVQIYHDGLRVASHLIGPSDFKMTTLDEHMPANHKFVKGLKNPIWVLSEAQKIGPITVRVVENFLSDKKHIEVGIRKALGVVRLKHQFPCERIEKAAAIALFYSQVSPRDIETILEQKLDEESCNKEDASVVETPFIHHENVRGSEYFNNIIQEVLDA